MLNPLKHRRILKKGMPGRATIVEMGAFDRGATSFNLPMTLQVHVEGFTPYEVEDEWMVKAKDTACLSGSIPVKVDPGNHHRVAIDWDGVRAEYEQHKAARQEALAIGGAGAFGGATVTVQGGELVDMSQNPELAQQIEQAMRQAGISFDQGAAGFGTGATGFGPPPGGEVDDTISQLERLSALRARGALSEEEFEQQKRRILGEA
jgi:Short C-terminal domain